MNETIEEGGFRVTSTSETPEQIKAIVSADVPEQKPEKPEPSPAISKAAAKLGAEGGKANAQRRAEEAQKASESTPATPDDPKPADEPETPPEDAEKLGKPRHDPKARMLEATRQAAELKRENAAIRAEREQLLRDLADARKAREAGAPAPAEEKSHDGTAKPKQDDYANWEEFLDARDVWNETQRAARTASERQANDFHAGVNTALNSFTKRMEEAAKSDPTLSERTQAMAALRPSFVLGKGEKIAAENVIADEIIQSEQAPALMLYLAEHEDEFQRLAALRTPFDIQMAMAKLEGRLTAAPTATVVKPGVSNASDPVRPVTGPPHLADKAPGPDAPYEEHKRYWGRRDRERSASR